jgi:hypothetical protein
MSGAPRWESPVEKQIREAMERGEFDNLPGAGKPLPNLDPNDDGMWWVRQLAQRERLDFSGALPPTLQLRKEAQGFPESLVNLAREESVREVLEDYNQRVRRDRLRPPDAGLPQLLAPTVDVDDLVDQWRTLRADRAAARGAHATEALADRAGTKARSRWWRRRRAD